MAAITKKTKKKIKVIGFDWGNTLGSNSDDWENYFKQILQLTGLSFEELQYGIFEKNWFDMRVGKLDAHDFWDEVYKQGKKKVSKGVLEKIYYDSLWFNPKMLSLVKSLKSKRYRLVIISNDDKNWMDLKRRKFNLDDLFEKIYVSAEMGLAKPHRDFYEYVLDDLKIEPKELLFIDNEQDNCQGAAKLGIHTIIFQNSSQLKMDLSKFLLEMIE